MNDVSTQTSLPMRIGDVAPDFSARSTSGPVRLSAYQGKWVLFFSHPADFTPVCTSEFIALARSADRFAELGCMLMGLSVDSLPSHIAWLKDIHARFGVKVGFPLIEDTSMVIARAFGMIDANATSSATVRATYVIDPVGVIRAISWYPMNVGRSVDELIRLVSALQAADATGASTPEAWRPGMPLVEPVAGWDVADDALGEGEAWYYRERRA